MDKKIIITIGRGKGSGGHYIGELLAAWLGIKCYDNEILYETAKNSGFTKEFIEQYEERKPSGFLYSFTSPSTQPLHQQLFLAQSKVIREIAKNESCIFVGRCADYVLRDMPELFSVFVYAPLADCIRRVQMGSDISAAEARRQIERADKSRYEYYHHFTDGIWGDAKTYHLSVNSGELTADGAAELIMGYLKVRKKYCGR